MADISFYHLTSSSLDHALPKLLEKSLQAGFRVLVRVSNEAEAERLSQWLWTFNPDSFLPHGTAKDGQSQAQPVYITEQTDNPNQAALLMVTHGQLVDAPEGFTRILDIFNGADDAQTTSARQRWKHYSTAGHTLTYIKQSPSGQWEKQAI